MHIAKLPSDISTLRLNHFYMHVILKLTFFSRYTYQLEHGQSNLRSQYGILIGGALSGTGFFCNCLLLPLVFSTKFASVQNPVVRILISSWMRREFTTL
jgi:hypothetical protein